MYIRRIAFRCIRYSMSAVRDCPLVYESIASVDSTESALPTISRLAHQRKDSVQFMQLRRV